MKAFLLIAMAIMAILILERHQMVIEFYKNIAANLKQNIFEGKKHYIIIYDDNVLKIPRPSYFKLFFSIKKFTFNNFFLKAYQELIFTDPKYIY